VQVAKFPNNGFSSERLGLLRQAIEGDIASGRYHGAVVMVAREGEVALHEAIGHSHQPSGTVAAHDDVFSLFSLSKAFTNVLALRWIEQGRFALTTRVAEVIPEFAGGLRERITFYHLLSHQSGIPTMFSPVPGMNLDVLADMVQAACAHVHCTEMPGEQVSYAPMIGQLLLGEAVRRTDPAGRAFRDIADQEIFAPLGMTSTAFGVRADLRARHRPVVPMAGLELPPHPSTNNLAYHSAFLEEHAEMPWVGAVSTASDLFRFAEMLRLDGELDGTRILGPAMLERATTNCTGDRQNNLYGDLAMRRGWDRYPATIGLGFFLRGETIYPHQFGTLASPRTFGNNGAGSTVLWVDPARDITFTCVTAGVMEEGRNIERFQRLSDLVLAAAL